jgi:RHS repeat-associated protein
MAVGKGISHEEATAILGSDVAMGPLISLQLCYLSVDSIHKSGTSAMSKVWNWLVLTLLWLITTMTHAGTRHYYYTDPQGTVLAEADVSGNITATYDYAPYGTAVANMSPAPDGPGYTGHVNDPDSGLVYMQARYYDPAVGRFLSSDPAPPVASDLFNFNRYDYTNNNPVINIDVDGRISYNAQLKKQILSVHIDDSLPMKDQKDLQKQVDAGIAKINEAKLIDSEVKVVQNIKSLDVSGTANRSKVDEFKGALTLTAEYVRGSSSSWLGSAVAHDGEHVELYNEGGVFESRGLGAEVKAMRFQRDVGIKMGLSSSEKSYLNNLISHPDLLKGYINSKP